MTSRSRKRKTRRDEAERSLRVLENPRQAGAAKARSRDLAGSTDPLAGLRTRIEGRRMPRVGMEVEA